MAKSSSFFVLLAGAILLGSSIASSSVAWAWVEADPIEASVRRGSVGQLVPSFYWIAEEPKNDKDRIHKLLESDGRLIARVSSTFLRRLKMEGTGRLADGRVINLEKRWRRRDGAREWRWRICGPEAPYGFGRDNRPLVPFRSVAVDPRVIPIGSKLFIPAAKGAVLPNGRVHDGVFHAVDIGDLIQRRKIDIFTAFGDQSRIFAAVGMSTGKPIEVFMIRRGENPLDPEWTGDVGSGETERALPVRE